MAAETVGDRIRHIVEMTDSHKKGRAFEEFLARHLPLIPDAEVKEAWRWKDVPLEIRRQAVPTAKSGQDFGIDLLALRHDGGFTAIQAKAYHKAKLTKKDVQSFLAATNLHGALTHRWIVATGSVSPMIRKMVGEGCSIVDPMAAWGGVELPEVGKPSPLQPDEIQRRAIDDCVEGLSASGHNHDRGRLIMACGLGKTLVSQRIAERIAFEGNPTAPLVVYATPSISLTAQSRRSWLRNAEVDLRTVVVCSDKDAGKSYDESVADFVEAPVSTDPAKIADALQRMTESADGAMTAVFCTYQSIDKVIDAQKLAQLTVDFAVADEAHNTTGKLVEKWGGGGSTGSGNFRKIHDELNARKRLYQTATPRIYRSKGRKGEARIVDMQDEDIYGPELHKTTFRQAIEEDSPRLCNFRVIAIVHEGRGSSDALQHTADKKKGKPVMPAMLSKTAALARAMYVVQADGAVQGDDAVQGDGDEGPVRLRSCIAYLNTIALAEWLADTLPREDVADMARSAIEADGLTSRDPHGRITAGHISGSFRQSQRIAELKRLGRATDDHGRHVTANCRVLSEGVDVPTLDAVAFLEPKKSVVEIIQAVGRVMRKPSSSDKKWGYVVVPIALDPRPDGDLFENLDEEVEKMSGDWETLGMVLQALKSHDPYLDHNIRDHLLVEFVDDRPRGKGGGDPNPFDHAEFTQKFFEHTIPVLVEKSGIRPGSKDIAHWMQTTVKNAAKAFAEDRLGSVAAGALEIGLPHGKGKAQEDALKKACETAALILVQASVMHHRIHKAHIKGEIEGLAGLEGMDSIKRSSTPCEMMLADLRALLRRDFAPVFEPAKRLLKAMRRDDQYSPGLNRAVRTIAENADEHADEYAKAGEDRAGAVFQQAMQNPSATGAFYTLPAPAILLAELACEALPADRRPWKLSEAELRRTLICDPACGTGTLLNAVKEAILERVPEVERKRTAKALVEGSIAGLDVNTHALQLSATQLTLNSLDADYRQMNLWRMPYGAKGANAASLGSLELLVREYMGQGEFFAADARRIADAADEGDAQLPRLREQLGGRAALIVTNPPYTVGGKQGKELPKRDRDTMQKKLKKLRGAIQSAAPPETAKVIDTDSASPFFTVMMKDVLLDENGGVLAKVCPLTALTSVSGIGERAFFLKHFDVLYVVTCHHPKDFNFSVDTDIHEAMLIMRRRDAVAEESSGGTRFASLERRPRDGDEARRMAKRIVAGQVGDGVRSVHHRSREFLERGRWTPVFYENPKLADEADWLEHLCHRRRAALAPFGSLYTANATGRTLRGKHWTFCDQDDPQREIDVLRSASNKAQKGLRGRPDGGAYVSGDGPSAAKFLMEWRAGHLHISSRQGADSGRVLSVVTERRCVGSAFAPVSNISVHEAGRLAVWMNCIVGRILMRHRHSKKLTYQWHEPAALAKIQIPKPLPGDSPKARDRDPLYRAWLRTRDTEVPLYREGRAPVHDIWDAAAARVLDVDPARLTKIREMLDREPSVGGVQEDGQ